MGKMRLILSTFLIFLPFPYPLAFFNDLAPAANSSLITFQKHDLNLDILRESNVSK